MHVWLPAAVLLVGLLCTFTVDRLVTRTLIRQNQTLLETHHQHFTDLVQSAINTRIQAVDLIAAGLSGDEHPASRFEPQSRRLLSYLPDVFSLDYLTRVTDDERAVVERELSDQSGQFIQFGQWQGSGNTLLAPTAPDYLVITRVEDRRQSNVSLGLVATSVPHWRQPIETALQQEKVSATAQTHIQRNGNSQLAVRLFKGLSNGTLVSLAFAPDSLLKFALPGQINPALQITVFDLDQHLKSPLFATAPLIEPNYPRALRSAISVADREWILTTLPDRHFMDGFRERAKQIIWLAGLITTVLSALLTWWLCRRLRNSQTNEHRQERAIDGFEQVLENNRIEKAALTRALQDSEQRSRDLVAIAGSVVAELDESGRIGFISAQTVDLLGLPPADMQDHLLTEFVLAAERDRFQQGMKAARQERNVVRIDLQMQGANDQPIPVTVRLKPVVDMLTGCAGFRVTLQSRPAMPEDRQTAAAPAR